MAVSEKAIIESILFAMGTPVSEEQLAQVLDCHPVHVRQLIGQMTVEYEGEDRGVSIIKIEDGYQLCTKKETYEYLIKLVSIPRNYRLTDVQLETLSIIAYKQPVTKAEIEAIRGVSPDHAVNRLIEAGLVEERGRKDSPGRPVLFGTTTEFLRRFGLSATDDLPDINTEKLETFKAEAEEEIGYVSDSDSGDAE